MDKRKQIEDFLDYGGNELFSTLMGGSMTRSVGIDRLVQLLQEYSDRCRRVRGRSGAYRFMLIRARRLGWLGRGSGDLKSHRLTREDREYIIARLDEYISSGGRNMRAAKRALTIGAVLLAAGLFVLAMVRYVKSEEYQRQLGGYFSRQQDYRYFVRGSGYTVPDGAEVVFIGNSLTARGRLPDYLGQMLADRGITVRELYVNGISLSEMYEIISEKQEWRDIVGSAECIILQDYGGVSDPQAIKDILDLDPELQHAYFFMTDFCIEESEKEYYIAEEYSSISEQSGYDVTPVGWGYISPKMADLFSWENFYYEDGYHPTELNGAVTAMLFYCFLTGERCEGVSLRLPPRLYDLYGEGELEVLLSDAEKGVSDSGESADVRPCIDGEKSTLQPVNISS